MCDMRYSLDESVQMLGKKWAAPVLMEIMSGKDSFNLLMRAIPGLNSKTLSARVSDFLNAGILVKNDMPTIPRQTQYSLTEKGEELRLLVRDLVGFSMRWHRVAS